jgi:hypothetical protein
LAVTFSYFCWISCRRLRLWVPMRRFPGSAGLFSAWNDFDSSFGSGNDAACESGSAEALLPPPGPPLRLSGLLAGTGTGDPVIQKRRLGERRPPKPGGSSERRSYGAVVDPQWAIAACSHSHTAETASCSTTCPLHDGRYVPSSGAGLRGSTMPTTKDRSNCLHAMRQSRSTDSMERAFVGFHSDRRQDDLAPVDEAVLSQASTERLEGVAGKRNSNMPDLSLCSHSETAPGIDAAPGYISTDEIPERHGPVLHRCIWVEAVLHGDCPAEIAQHSMLEIRAKNGTQWQSICPDLDHDLEGSPAHEWHTTLAPDRNTHLRHTASQPVHQDAPDASFARVTIFGSDAPASPPLRQTAAVALTARHSRPKQPRAAESRLHVLRIPCGCRLASNGVCELEIYLHMRIKVASETRFGCTLFAFDQQRTPLASPHFVYVTISGGNVTDRNNPIGRLQVTCERASNWSRERMRGIPEASWQRATWLLPTSLHDPVTAGLSQAPNETELAAPLDMFDVFWRPAANCALAGSPSRASSQPCPRSVKHAPDAPVHQRRASGVNAAALGIESDAPFQSCCALEGASARAAASRVSPVTDAWSSVEQAETYALWSFSLDSFEPVAAVEPRSSIAAEQLVAERECCSLEKPDFPGVGVACKPPSATSPHSSASGTPGHASSDSHGIDSQPAVDPDTAQAFARVRERIRGKSKRFTLYAITLSDLRSFFHLPRDVVARHLGICVTLLKKIARRNGIAHWPYRRLKTLRSKIAALEVELQLPSVVDRNGRELCRQLQQLRQRMQQIQGNGAVSDDALPAS